MNKLWGFILLCVFVTGCTSYHIAKPIEPKAGWPRFLASVDTLNPELKWAPYFEGPYDIIVYELRDVDDEGKQFYTAENLEGTSHIIQRKLKPGMVYRWAVKKHSLHDYDNTWSHYSYFVFYGVGYSYFYDVLFGFKTQKEP